jgi:hypothetical protein
MPLPTQNPMTAVIEKVINIEFQFMPDTEIITEIIFAQVDGGGDIHTVVTKID